MQIKLTAMPLATQRTKNRLREHGPLFNVIVLLARPICFDGLQATQVESVKTGWVGWLPIRELKEG